MLTPIDPKLFSAVGNISRFSDTARMPPELFNIIDELITTGFENYTTLLEKSKQVKTWIEDYNKSGEKLYEFSKLFELNSNLGEILNGLMKQPN